MNIHMKVFLRQIPPDSTLEEIYGFVSSAMGPRWYAPFRQNGEIHDCQILNISGSDGERLETHCVVNIEPMEVAARTIIWLNGRELKGKVVEVRTWYERSAQQDRRGSSKSADFQGPERRHKDRRRPGLKLQFLPAI